MTNSPYENYTVEEYIVTKLSELSKHSLIVKSISIDRASFEMLSCNLGPSGRTKKGHLIIFAGYPFSHKITVKRAKA